MAGPDEEQPDISSVPVPDLIARYRLRRDAWIAQADELARLRDDVRGAAEREAMEIVTAARRDVRRIVMEARRELLVLSAQVQAVLGEQAAAAGDGAARLGPALGQLGDESDLRERLGDQPLVGEDAVRQVLEEARADMAALADEARAVPFQIPQPLVAAPAYAPVVEEEEEEDEDEQEDEEDEVEAATAAPFLPEPPPRSELRADPFRKEAVTAFSRRPIRPFVAVFVAAGVVLLLGIFWWAGSSSDQPSQAAARNTAPAAPAQLRVPAAAPTTTATAPASSPSSSAPATAAPASSTAARPPSPAPVARPAASAAAPVAAPANQPPAAVSVLVEARRPAWIRATVDGRSDAGRTLKAGESVTLNGARSVSLRVGDAGAVLVSINKSQPQPLGRDGEVVTREFGVARPVTVEVPKQTPPVTPPPPTPTRTAPVASAVPPPAPARNVPVASPIPAPSQPAVTRPFGQPLPATSTPPETVREQRPSAPQVATPSPAPPQPSPSPARNEVANAPASPRNAVIAAAQQWLDAYQRQDRSTLASLSTENIILADERQADERVPPGVDARRTLDQINVQIAADTAVVTAVMTERADAGGVQRVSPVSQVWVYGDGKWRARQVRLVSEAALSRIFR